ncbi:hypothetical protein GCM10009840_04510 [Pseudolysinimonas kribbensis]|uniref:Uncharacterized protein n=1 Tax=Pseudolysinimonas kribbensis TaxID=433641 RepID=A0ABQ6K2D7_9MICO|nr:hypothetical protein [Pseudolysinimonas kribbensis]GMA94785.1 hypothetical protein GCM10025881_16090 [Pseudolysinimonas kribbensis]
MSAGFGRLVLGGSIVDDPYADGLEEIARFEVISDDGPRYRIDRREPDDPVWDGPSWGVTRIQPAPDAVVGTIIRRGLHRLQYQYEFRKTGAHVAGGADAMLVNAVFGLIGEL